MDDEKLYCKNCGEEVSIYTGFCPKCGTNTKRPSKKETAKPKKKKSGGGFAIVALIIILIAVAVFAVYKFVGLGKVKDFVSQFNPFTQFELDKKTPHADLAIANTDTQETINHTDQPTSNNETATNTNTSASATASVAVIASSTTSPSDEEQIIVIDKSNNCFHVDLNCDEAKKIDSNNKLTAKGTIEQLIAKGYKPCSVCVKTTPANS